MVTPLKECEVERRVRELRAQVAAGGTKREALARELLELSRRRQADDRYDDAVTAAREGIEVLSAMFVDDPQTCTDAMYALVTQYTSLCRHGSAVPDEALLAPISAAFGREIDRSD